MTALDDWGFGANSWLVDEMARRYEADPASVGPEWRALFDGGTGGSSTVEERRPPAAPPAEEPAPEGWAPLPGPAQALARTMAQSLQVPTATSIRTVPAKLLQVNRRRLNRYLLRTLGGRVSYTHLIGWAVTRAAVSCSALRRVYAEVGGRPGTFTRPGVDLGIAVDVLRSDGTRALMAPVVRGAGSLGFAGFVAAYDDLVARARSGRISPDELVGPGITLTNPGTIGTSASVPRLPEGQSAIVGVGAVGAPPEYAAADPDRLAEVGVGPVTTLTCTYDHRVIQGAESGEFLRLVGALLLGKDDFYGEVFAGLEVPFRPIRWGRDVVRVADPVGEAERHARVLQLINNYRVRGHLIAHLDPLATSPPETHPELDPATLGFSLWDLDRRFATGGLADRHEATLEEVWDILRDAYCGTLSVEYMHIQEPDQ
ncbi:MAG TPA: 2-oxo acid dehydrogenase subunit E2, partial [Actinomycetota bacterium]|nr:2-oxo acid dehydrogenase subunit E2 [Actinomycetota bacterium]